MRNATLVSTVGLALYLCTFSGHAHHSFSAQFDAKKPLNRVGLDSLMGLELKNRIETDLGVSLPMAGLIEGPSISRVAAQLLPLLDGAPAHTA